MVLSLSLICGSVACSAPPGPPAKAPEAKTTETEPEATAAQAPAQAAPAKTPAKPGQLLTESFGGDRWGFAEASSDNGRFVVLRRFQGTDPPSFGHHGETAQAPELGVFDRVSGGHRVVDEIIDVEPSRRWFLFLDDGQLWLADASTGAWNALANADMNADMNACLPPRQATFSPEGKRVAWVTKGASELTVRDLASGDEWTVAAKGRLWRGWAYDDGRAAVFIEVDAAAKDWPMQRTSCACRWCNRFAMSYGVYGWGGPAFKIEKVAEDGTRSAAEPPDADRKWHDITGSGCELTPADKKNSLERGPWVWKC